MNQTYGRWIGSVVKINYLRGISEIIVSYKAIEWIKKPEIVWQYWQNEKWSVCKGKVKETEGVNRKGHLEGGRIG